MYNNAGAVVMASKIRELINSIRDIRHKGVNSGTLDERDLYHVREGFRLGLSAAAVVLAGELDTLAGESGDGCCEADELEWWDGIDGSSDNPGPEDRLETAADEVERKDANKSRQRWYGLRIGDIVAYRSMSGGDDGTLYEVVGYMRTDNNAVILRRDDGVVDKYVAEWCDVVVRAESRPAEALAWL